MSYYHKVAGSIPLVCTSKCPCTRYVVIAYVIPPTSHVRSGDLLSVRRKLLSAIMNDPALNRVFHV